MNALSNQEFNRRLEAAVMEMSPSELLAHGGIRAILAEKLFPAIVEQWAQEQSTTTKDGPKDGDITTHDLIVWYRSGKTWLIGNEAAVKAKMTKQKHLSTIWFVSPTGEAVPITL